MLRWLPENISTFGADIDGIMYLIYYVVGIWFLAAEGILFYFVFRYHRRVAPAAAYAPGRSLGSLGWVLVPAFLVLLCDVVFDSKGAHAWERMKQHVPRADVLVRIEARQFAWNFRDAGLDGALDTGDDVVTNGRLHVPVDRNVRFELVSRDVLHSLWIPNLRLKQDAVPGRTIPGWFSATRTGVYGIGCAELCGVGHGVMGATLIVQTEAEYRETLRK
jgi:cytochrome c oxidase subunit 2